MSPLIVTLSIIILLLLTRLTINLTNPPSEIVTYKLSPFTQPRTFKVSCDDCYRRTDCDECPLDCEKCSLSHPPNCATCTPSCASCDQDCPLDCDKCKEHCLPNCTKCKEHCPPECTKLTSKCELPFYRCQAFIHRIKFSGGYLTSLSKVKPSTTGWRILIRFIPRSVTGGLFNLDQMGFYIEASKVKMYLQDEIRTLTTYIRVSSVNTLRFSQEVDKNYFTLSINNSEQRFSPKVPNQVFNSHVTLGRCIDTAAPAASKVPFIGCMQDLQINRLILTFNKFTVKENNVTAGCE